MGFEDFDGLKRPHLSHRDVKRLLYLWKLFAPFLFLFFSFQRLCIMLSGFGGRRLNDLCVMMVDNLQTISNELLAQATFLCPHVSSFTAKKKKEKKM